MDWFVRLDNWPQFFLIAGTVIVLVSIFETMGILFETMGSVVFWWREKWREK